MDYKELSKQLRYCGDIGKCQSCEFYRETEHCSPNLLGEAADAIEELTKKQAVYLSNVEIMSNLLSRFGTELDDIKAMVSHLQDSQHYSGRYIKSIMGVSDEDDK